MRPGRGTLAAVAALAVLHAAVTVAAIAYGFGMTMDRFDAGGDATATERAIDMLVAVLMFPLGHLATRVPGWIPGPTGILPLLANGALWAIPPVAGWRFLRRSRG